MMGWMGVVQIEPLLEPWKENLFQAVELGRTEETERSRLTIDKRERAMLK